MKFETVYKMMETAGVKNLEIAFFGKEFEGFGHDCKETWSCTPEQLPFWVSALDVHSAAFSDSETSLYIFLEMEETEKYWDRIIDLA